MVNRRQLRQKAGELKESVAGTLGSSAERARSAAQSAGEKVQEKRRKRKYVEDQSQARVERAKEEAQREARIAAREEFIEEYREELKEDVKEKEKQRLKRQFGVGDQGGNMMLMGGGDDADSGQPDLPMFADSPAKDEETRPVVAFGPTEGGSQKGNGLDSLFGPPDDVDSPFF